MNRRGQQGFTLMETVLAVTLFVVVVASSFNIFGMGLQIWKRTKTDSKSEQKVLLALEKMGQDLRGMTRIKAPSDEFSINKGNNVEYGGSDLRIQFPAAYGPGEHPTLGGYGRTTYQWNPGPQEICRSVENAADLYSNKKFSCRTMVADVVRFKIRYWLPAGLEDSYAWYDSWDSKEAMPLAVEITLELKPESRFATRRVFKKTVMIPVGGKYDPKTT
jgi:type II secretion system protein J